MAGELKRTLLIFSKTHPFYKIGFLLLFGLEERRLFMGDQRDDMLKLMEKLKENDVGMSIRPEHMSIGNHMIVTFRKWSDRRKLPYNQSRIFAFYELRNLNVRIEDLLIDMVDKFVRDFNKEEEKHYASKRPNKE